MTHLLSWTGLNHEGLFRISGNHRVVESLKVAFDRGDEIVHFVFTSHLYPA